MSFDSVSTFSVEFQFSETLINSEDFNTEFFKAAIVKDSEA